MRIHTNSKFHNRCLTDHDKITTRVIMGTLTPYIVLEQDCRNGEKMTHLLREMIAV